MSDKIYEGAFYAFMLVWTFILTYVWYTFFAMIFNSTTPFGKTVNGLLAAIAGIFTAVLPVMTTIYKDCWRA